VTQEIILAALQLGVPIYDTSRTKLWGPGSEVTEGLREFTKVILAEENVAKEQYDSDLLSSVGSFVKGSGYDDTLDAVFKRIAPNMVRHVLEREINEDMSEFLDGAIEGRFERKADWAAQDPSPQELGNPQDSADYLLGYRWGWDNANTWEGNELPPAARKQAIENQIAEFEGQVSEQMVIAALEAANEKVNPIKLLGKAKDAIHSAVQEDGWVGGLKKGLPIAVGIIVGEALDNFIIPMAVYSLTGLPIPPLPIGVGEIINPIVINMVGASVESGELADELAWYEERYGTVAALGPDSVSELRAYVASLLVEKELRGQKDKRTLYHIGKRPAEPKPAERWGEKGGWDRPWIDRRVKSGVFLTTNPTDIAWSHGVSGNVYAYKVPHWVIEKAGGVHRFDTGSEILISEEIWEEAGDEIEFLGKTMDQKDLWDKVDSSYYSAKQKKGRRAKHNKPGEVWVDGIAGHPNVEDIIKMLKTREKRQLMTQLQDMYPEALKGEPFEVEWTKPEPGERKGYRKDFRRGEKRIAKDHQELLDLLKKHMNESIIREYVSGLLVEVPLDDFAYLTQDDDDVMVREEVANYFKAIPQSVNIYVAHTDDLSWAHRLPNEIQGKVSGFKSRGQVTLTDISNIGKLYPQIQRAMNPEGINLLYVYPKSFEVPAGGDTFIADVNAHYLAHDLHHMLEGTKGLGSKRKRQHSLLS
jgi:hypothetical protein